MKIICYTLTPEGTIPVYVLDGGYFPASFDLPWPQDLLLCGVVEDDAPQEAIPSEAALADYVSGISGDWLMPDGEPFDAVAAAAWLWGRL